MRYLSVERQVSLGSVSFTVWGGLGAAGNPLGAVPQTRIRSVTFARTLSKGITTCGSRSWTNRSARNRADIKRRRVLKMLLHCALLSRVDNSLAVALGKIVRQ